MLRRISNILFIILSVAMMASCHHSDNPEPEVPTQKTLLFYWPYTGTTNNLYEAFTKNISDIELAIRNNGGIGNNRILYFISFSKTTSYLIDVDCKKGSIIRDTLKTYRSPALTTGECITGILNDVRRYAPSENYAMVIGSHGEGWMPAFNTSQRKSRFFGSGTNDCQTDITTLAQSIENAGLHLQYLLFDCCYMSCIENAYDLRKVTDHLIASTSEVMGYGMPYNMMLNAMLKPEPDYEGINNAFHEFYNNYSEPYGTLGITDTRYIDDIASIMRNINANYSISEKQLLTVQDLDADHHFPTIYYDMGDYVNKILSQEEGEDDAQKHQLLDEFNQTMQLLVPIKSSTEQIISVIGWGQYTTIPVTTFSGLTISDPSSNLDVVNSKKNTNWWKATHQ